MTTHDDETDEKKYEAIKKKIGLYYWLLSQTPELDGEIQRIVHSAFRGYPAEAMRLHIRTIAEHLAVKYSNQASLEEVRGAVRIAYDRAVSKEMGRYLPTLIGNKGQREIVRAETQKDAVLIAREYARMIASVNPKLKRLNIKLKDIQDRLEWYARDQWTFFNVPQND